MNTTLTTLLDIYDKNHAVYMEFKEELFRVLSRLLKETSLQIHSINARVKDRESLEKKINKGDGKYTSLNQITDICGLRVITYFAEDVDEVADIVKSKFKVDPENSIDKRKLLDPDRFGYLSSHFVIELPEERLILDENKKFKNLKAEIQIRSIIQHAWAEIEHDLGYKNKGAVPKDVKRRFFRLAALLEIADDEFTRIKGDVIEYKKYVEANLATNPQNILIDKTSLTIYVNKSAKLENLDQRIADILGATLTSDSDTQADIINARLPELSYLRLETLSDIEESIEQYAQLIYEFAKVWIGARRVDEIPRGTSLLYLCYILAANTEDRNFISEFLSKTNAPFDSSILIKAYEEAMAKLR